MASISPSLASPPPHDFPSLFAGIQQMEGPLEEAEEKRLYFATNEKNPERTITTLEQMPLRGNTVLAVSGIFALNILAARIQAARRYGGEITGLILVDKSPVVESFWIDISKIIAGEPGGHKPGMEEVVFKIQTLITTKKDYFFDSPLQSDRRLRFHLGRFQTEIRNGSSFASSIEKFVNVQKIFRTGRFKFLRLDLTEPASFQALGAVLRENRLPIDTAYFSNVLQFTRSPDVAHFQASAEAIMNTNTLIVDAEPACLGQIDPQEYVQRVRERGSSPASELFIPAAHDYGILSRAIAVRDRIGFVLQVARRTIAATYTYFMATPKTQVEART